jgi:two-component system, OmpR family, phosphate regulon response regulator PhoB
VAENPPRILVVEDVPVVLTVLRMRLEAEGFAVLTARDGVEALEQVRSAQPDLVLLDLMLPRLNGERVCQELRADPRTRTLPIVVLSARVGEVERLRALAAGADTFISKPYDVKQLIDEIRARLAARGRAIA